MAKRGRGEPERDVTWEFLLAAFIVVASPGTGAIYTLAAGLSGGARAGLLAAFGCTLGILPHLVAAIGGVATLMQNDMAFLVLRIAGVAYLAFMAWSMLRGGGAFGMRRDEPAPKACDVVTKAILVNVLNPKLAIFFLAFLPQFIESDEAEPIREMLLLAMVFMAVTFVVFAGYGIFAATLRQILLASRPTQRWLRLGFAAAFGLLALQLAFFAR